jgi:hypothetical protein
MEAVVPLRRILSRSTIALLVLTASAFPGALGESGTSLRGIVESGGTGLAAYEVSLYARFVGRLGTARVLGRATTGPAGEFEIDYQLPPGLPSSLQPMLFVRAESGPAMLASAIGQAPVPGPVVVNERTTVATGFAFAQFVDGSEIEGNRYGMLNAIRMAANMVDPKTGTVAAVLHLPPNGPETTALRTFNSLANIVAYCIATEIGCKDLFDASTVPGGARPANVLQTLAVIGPKGNLIEVILPESPPGRTQLRRPMGVASDSRGNIWVANSDFMDVPCPPHIPDLAAATAPSIALFLRHPDRKPHVDSPFTGGGLTIPWRVAVDGNDTVWVADFGFPLDLAHLENTAAWEAPNRVSHFCGVDTSQCPPPKREVGKAISPDGTGYTSDALDRNTGIAIDPSGNVWLANNWKPTPLINNPGGNSIAVLIGVAAPLDTPLIGTPRSFDRWPAGGRGAHVD